MRLSTTPFTSPFFIQHDLYILYNNDFIFFEVVTSHESKWGVTQLVAESRGQHIYKLIGVIVTSLTTKSEVLERIQT